MITGAVTFMDVVGWTGIWRVQTDAIAGLITLIQHLENVSRRVTEEISQTAEASFRGTTTQILSISDTVVFLTKGAPDTTLEIHGRICQEALSLSIQKKIPLRGATSYGKYTFEGNIMTGPAIDESASWHESIDWFGSILTPSANFIEGINNECFLDYAAPQKGGKIFRTKCINWIGTFVGGVDPAHRRKFLCDTFIDMGPIHPEIEPKYSNTLKFFDHCVSVVAGRP